MKIKENRIINTNRFMKEIKKVYESSSQIIKEIFYYFDYDKAKDIFMLEYFDEIKNSEYPFLLDVTMTYCDGLDEKLLAVGYKYIKEEDIILVRLLSNSFHDDSLVEGVLLSTRYDQEKGLLIENIIKED